MLASHTATLAAIARDKGSLPRELNYEPVITAVVANLNRGEEFLHSVKSGNQNSSGQSVEVSANPGSIGVPEKETDFETPAEIRKVNEQVLYLVNKRKSELEQGIRESETGRRITLVKSVNDQFNFVWKISEDLLKILNRVNLFLFLCLVSMLSF
jgi:hypothetical protein